MPTASKKKVMAEEGRAFITTVEISRLLTFTVATKSKKTVLFTVMSWRKGIGYHDENKSKAKGSKRKFEARDFTQIRLQRERQPWQLESELQQTRPPRLKPPNHPKPKKQRPQFQHPSQV